MQPSTIEIRTGIVNHPAVIVVGWRVGIVPSLEPATIDWLLRTVESGANEIVVFDLTGLRHLRSDLVSDLIDLSRKSDFAASIVLWIEESGLRLALRDAELTGYFPIVGAIEELRNRVAEMTTEPTPGHPAYIDPQEIAAARINGVTLDELIEELEAARP